MSDNEALSEKLGQIKNVFSRYLKNLELYDPERFWQFSRLNDQKCSSISDIIRHWVSEGDFNPFEEVAAVKAARELLVQYCQITGCTWEELDEDLREGFVKLSNIEAVLARSFGVPADIADSSNLLDLVTQNPIDGADPADVVQCLTSSKGTISKGVGAEWIHQHWEKLLSPSECKGKAAAWVAEQLLQRWEISISSKTISNYRRDQKIFGK